MDINYAKNQITLFGKVCRLDTIVKKLSTLSGKQLYNFLIDRTTQLPRRINCLAMVSVLNNKIKFLHSNSLPKEYFMKLQYYQYFSEHQLFMLFNKICDVTDFMEYRVNLVSLILENYKKLNLNDGELVYLKQQNKQAMEDFPTYFNYVTGACLEQDDTFDGQNIELLKNNLQYSASNQDIFDLAGKYGVPLPQRLKREEYLEYILDYLKRKGTYSEEVAVELNGYNITQISTYARRTGINMQPNMSKTDLITYFFYFLDQCEIPTTSVEDLIVADKYKHLDFRVDLQAIGSFGVTENKKVIYYANDQEDQENLNNILNGVPKEEEIKTEEIVEAPKPKVEEVPVVEEVVEAPKPKEEEVIQVVEEPVIAIEEEVKEEVVSAPAWKSIYKNPEEEKKKEEARKKAEEEAKAQEELLANDIINETLAGIKEKEIEELEDPRINVDTKLVDVNPDYETGNIEKLVKGKGKTVLVGLSIGCAAVMIIASILGLLLL